MKAFLLVAVAALVSPLGFACAGDRGWDSQKSSSLFHAPASLESESDEEPDVAMETERADDSLGFINLGNTCFANSVHQLLLSHPELKAAISHLPRSEISKEELGSRQAVQKAFIELAQEYWKRKSSSSRPLGVLTRRDPHFSNRLKLLFDSLDAFLKVHNPDHDFYLTTDLLGAPKYLRHDQIDAHEYLLKLLDVLDAEHFLKGFQFVSEIVFPDGEVHQKQDQMFQLDLKIEGRGIRSVSDALGEFLSSEELNDPKNLVKKNDGTPSISTRYSKLTSLNGHAPQALIVSLSRFRYTLEGGSQKVLKTVHVDEPLSVPFEGPGRRGSVQSYIPSAVVIHRGSARSGHYVAYIRDPGTDDWWLHDDDSPAVRVGYEKAMSEIRTNGYLILYTSKGTR